MKSAEQKSKTAARIFLFHGPDSYTARKKAEQWQSAFAQKHTSRGIIRLQAQEEGFLKHLAAALTESGLFSETRLVICRGIFDLPAEEQVKAGELMENLSNDVFLVIWEEAAAKKSLKLYKKLAELEKKGLAKIYEFQIPAGLELGRFIRQYCAEKKAEISSEAEDELAVAVGRDLAEKTKTASGYQSRQAYDLWRVSSELDKLIAFAGGRKIEVRDVRALVAPVFSENVFLLTDALGRRDRKAAKLNLDRLLSGLSGDATSRALNILGALAGSFHSILELKARENQARGISELAGLLGWSPYRVTAVRRLSEGFTIEQLREILRHLAKIDRKIKSTQLPVKVLFTEFLIKI
jgi:DNA polymerase III delta subunit